jgi:hypothetical protein
MPSLGQPDQSTLDALERAPVREGDEQRIVAGDRARDLGPARPVEGGCDGMGGTRQRAQDQQQPGVVDLQRQVGQELAEAVLAGRLRFDEPRRQRVRGRPFARDLDQAKLGDVARDGGLGGPEATLAERGRELLLGPDGALVHEIPDRTLPELLHDLHGAGRRRPASEARRR